MASFIKHLQFRGASNICCFSTLLNDVFFLFFALIDFIFKLYIIVLVLPNIKMNPPQVNDVFKVFFN